VGYIHLMLARVAIRAMGLTLHPFLTTGRSWTARNYERSAGLAAQGRAPWVGLRISDVFSGRMVIPLRRVRPWPLPPSFEKPHSELAWPPHKNRTRTYVSLPGITAMAGCAARSWPRAFWAMISAAIITNLSDKPHSHSCTQIRHGMVLHSHLRARVGFAH